jgi:glycine/D-amino acid oxidase-like deaminating enzyme
MSVWWQEEAGLDAECPPLKGDRTADVVIVGGGYCGLWTALALKERGPALDVVVLEAEYCGEGPSGRNGGFLHGYWSSLPSLVETFGDEHALAIARASTGAVGAVRALDEDVWLREGGLLKVSAAVAQDDAVERSLAEAARLGVPEEAVAVDALHFRRGVFFRDGATVQPARLARALRRAALDAGVAIHEQTPARRVEPAVETPGGTVRARETVLATGRPPLPRRLTHFSSYVVLTQPVPELLEEIGWTGGEAIMDARMFLHYFRTTPDGRVLMGSGSGPIGPYRHDAASIARAERGLRRLLPALAGTKITHAWGGPIDVSADRFPFVGTLPGSRVRYAAGFSGNGVGPTWLAGQILASLVTGREDDWTSLPLLDRRPRRSLPPEPLKRLGGNAVRRAILRVEEAEEEGREPPAPARAIAAVPRILGIQIGVR